VPTIDISDDISIHYSDPMKYHITVMHCDGDFYNSDTSCGNKLINLHKTLQTLDLPFDFVKIVTTNNNIAHELNVLKSLYSTECDPIEYELHPGYFKKQVYKGKTSCILPWIHKYVNPQGLVMPCCVGNEKYPIGNINHNNLEDISTKTIRTQMQKGQRPDSCSHCYETEDLGLISKRQKANDSFVQYKLQQDFVLRYIDIRLSNKCNLMCRMCSGKYSNRIAQEEEKLYGFTKYKDEILDDRLIQKQLDYIKNNIDTIERVYFAGGEPLINKEHYDILNLLIDYKKTDVKINYNSNFSMLKFKKYNVLDYWDKFSSVSIGASLDLLGPQSNYVRYGVEYDVLENNYHLVKDRSHIDFAITSTLHIMNIFNLPSLQKHWIELGLDCSKINFNILTTPKEQCLTVLPEHYKNLASVKIYDHIQYLKNIPNSTYLISNWEQTQKFMITNNDSHLLGEFFRLNDDKDRVRNQNFEDYYPEYKDLRKYA
jgi:MoaA/NifB/PqqE/SkfB family radical SAM enzyme